MYVNACSGINYVKKIPPIVAIYLFIYLQRGSPKYLIMWLWLINIIIILNDQIFCVDPFRFQLLTCQTRPAAAVYLQCCERSYDESHLLVYEL